MKSVDTPISDVATSIGPARAGTESANRTGVLRLLECSTIMKPENLTVFNGEVYFNARRLALGDGWDYGWHTPTNERRPRPIAV
jgi:hypothetical protein